jgi:hypothetical protein
VWGAVYASTVKGTNVIATGSVEAQALGGGAGGAVKIGAGTMTGTTDFVTYTGHTNGGSDNFTATITAKIEGVKQYTWLTCYVGSSKYAIPLFIFTEVTP